MTPPPEPEEEQQLAKLLGEIGTKRRSIAPVVLEEGEYAERLRLCPHIAARLPPSASNATVAAVANAAIITTIEDMPSPTDRLVAKAALGIGKFEGVLLKQRKLDVANTKDTGCDQNAFRRRRERLLPFIARQLLRDDAPVLRRSARTMAPARPAPSESEGEGYLRNLAAAAVNLYYHCLGVMFFMQYHYLPRHLPPENKSRRYRRNDFNDVIWDELSRAVLMRGVVPYQRNVETLEHYFKEKGTTEASELLTREHQQKVQDLVELIRIMLPLDSEQNLLLVLHGDGYVTEDEANLGRVLKDIWKPWFNEALFRTNDRWWGGWGLPSTIIETSPGEPPLNMELLAARSSAIQSLITQHLSHTEPVVSIARRRARKLVSYAFEPDDFEPLIDGRSLRELLDMFFDEQDILLGSPAIVWFNSTKSTGL